MTPTSAQVPATEMKFLAGDLHPWYNAQGKNCHVDFQLQQYDSIFYQWMMRDTMTTCSDCSETGKPGHRSSLAPLTGIILALLLLLLGGCAASTPQGQQGGLVPTDAVRIIFESNTVLPNHVYYYSGPEAEPEAIIGIHADFTLQGRYWHKIDLTVEQLQSWNKRIDNAHRIRFAYKGARIMTPDGRQAGVWYSKFEETPLCFQDKNTILMDTPDPPPVRGGSSPCFPYLQF
ncbi:MAG: hypothetical protein ACYC9M_01640 [Desulfobulbaceae bacterium]